MVDGPAKEKPDRVLVSAFLKKKRTNPPPPAPAGIYLKYIS